MEIIFTIFNEILYRPLLNVLFLFYQYIPGHDIGVAVILLTLLIRFIFYPLGIQAIKSQKQNAELQPKIKAIQEKYKNDKEAQTKAIMEFYKENKFNPLSGCLPTLVQLPFLFALYQVFLKGLDSKILSETVTKFYTFVPRPESVNMMFLGLIDLSQKSIILAILAGILQYLQFKTMPTQIAPTKSKGDIMQAMNSQMGYIFPIITVFICMSLPSAIALYWIATTIFSIAQQLLISKKIMPNNYDQQTRPR